MRTMAQKRSEYALGKSLNLRSDKKEFKSFSAGAPSMILQNGFGQTLAFWLAKGTDKDRKIKEDDKHIELFDIVINWLSFKQKDINNDFIKQKGRKEVMHELSTIKQKEYLAAQNETLALLEWIKRFAAADLS